MAKYHIKKWGGFQSPTEAFRFAQIGVEKNIPNAFGILGWCYEKKIGVHQDLKKAEELYTKGVSLGDALSQCCLGYCYGNRGRLQREFSAKFSSFSNGCLARIRMAQYNLGCCYEEGLGVQRNIPEAIRFFRLSAQQGFLDGQYNFAVTLKMEME